MSNKTRKLGLWFLWLLSPSKSITVHARSRGGGGGKQRFEGQGSLFFNIEIIVSQAVMFSCHKAWGPNLQHPGVALVLF